MIVSIWRYSHLTLAISSFLFILIASITGILLAFEPISNQLKPYAINIHEISLSETLNILQQEYPEIITLKVDQNNFVTTSVITKEGNNETFYINPKTGKKISPINPQASIYKFATNLHRSLFLKSTGRFIVALFSFLLFLITLTGTLIIFKRQGGIKKLFTKVIYEDFKQFYHVVLGRLFLIPIIIITITGIYLSLEKFSLLPKTKIKHQYISSEKNSPKIPIKNFVIFNTTKLSEMQSLEFPFSDDMEDYFFLKLRKRELLIHQYSGEIISNQKLSWVKIISDWSLFLHTGRGSIGWSIVLLLSCLAILFFIYSGFAIAIYRNKKKTIIKNQFKKDNAEFIILVGSETGNTFRIADSFFKALIDQKKSVYIDNLNNYTTYLEAKYLIILTSTYGEGEAPINASKFIPLLHKTQLKTSIKYAIIGLGSLAYPDYCKFAIDIENALLNLNNFTPLLPLTKINNQNFSSFKLWILQFNKKLNSSLEVKQLITNPLNQESFTIIKITNINIDNTYLIRLKPHKKQHFSSGDLLAITPKKDNLKRLYSIGKIEDDILLSIKKHDLGICSNLLFNLQKNDILKAKIEKNKAFNLPIKTKEAILIANGTGIAPFLGMINRNHLITHVFWGIKTKQSIDVYKPYLKYNTINYVFSQEGNKEYVQDSIAKEEQLIINVLKNNGTIMICGSIAMMNQVLFIIESSIRSNLNTSLNKFRHQIKTDCY